MTDTISHLMYFEKNYTLLINIKYDLNHLPINFSGVQFFSKFKFNLKELRHYEL